MSFWKKYDIIGDTLTNSASEKPFYVYLIRGAIYLAAGFLCLWFYGYLYTVVLGLKAPKTALLELRNSELMSECRLMHQRVEEHQQELVEIQMRDNTVYRSIFGMDPIPAEIRDAGFAGETRYSSYADYAHAGELTAFAKDLDIVSKKAAIQSRSFDEVELLSHRAGDMAACVPGINPVDMKAPGVRFSSPFGYRIHPIYHRRILHHGTDIVGPVGTPVYATGDAVVEKVEKNHSGYGVSIVLNHGFGYKTRYAHLKGLCVREGQSVRRGEKIAVLEAMKMENEIQTASDGTVTAIHVSKGDSVLEGAAIATIA